MPNWTYNRVTVTKGNCDLHKYIGEDKGFDFNKIIPEPKSFEECMEKYGENYIDHGDKHLQHTENNKWFDWYGWRCDFWGTKWNACNTDISDDGETVWFNTAWSEPTPIWENISIQNPDCTFEMECEYEEGFWTRSEWENGVEISYTEWEEPFDDEEYDEVV